MSLLSTIILFPLCSFAALLLLPPLKRGLFSTIVLLGPFLSLIMSVYFWLQGDAHLSITDELFVWIPTIDTIAAQTFSLKLDTLSLTMCLVVSFVSTLIVLYSLAYMKDDRGETRFFATVNLFIFFMLLLVLANNVLGLFIGWEGVGLCSFILIGFYYEQEEARKAALKAFITTRVGDVFLFIGMLLMLYYFGTLEISVITEAVDEDSIGITLIAFCLLLGAVGKSAQFPLQTWLADAMWGPTPVSALIHAATMVTAGVYLIARFNGLVGLSDEAMTATLWIGTGTMVFAGLIASVQSDLKKVLAYSTMSQLGLMFMALGLGAFQAAIFHLVTHAFFKALLFLGAGVIGHSLHTYDLRKMGGLKKDMPLLFWLFLIGALNLMGLPLLTAGYFSKEWILGIAHHEPIILGLGLLGTFLTGFYTWRLMTLVFFKHRRGEKAHPHYSFMLIAPLVILSASCFVLGFFETPTELGNIALFSNWLKESLPVFKSEEGGLLWLFLPAFLAALGALGAHLFARKLTPQTNIKSLMMLLRNGLFDPLYELLFYRPYTLVAQSLKEDVVDAIGEDLARNKQVFNAFYRFHERDVGVYIIATIWLGIGVGLITVVI